jgi:hypothetical protein
LILKRLVRSHPPRKGAEMGNGSPTGCRVAENVAEGLEEKTVQLNTTDEKELNALKASTEEDALQQA